MMGRSFICGALLLTLAGVASAGNSRECDPLRGQGAGSSDLPRYQVELKLFDCAGMTKDVEALDALDRDMMVVRAKSMPLKELRGQQTKTDPPRKYSELTSASRLAKFKRLVDAYYKP